MRIGILSDTHDQLARTRNAVRALEAAGAEAIIHCGDLVSAPIVEACSLLTCWFVLGNQDSDNVPELEDAAVTHGVCCLGWGGIVEQAGKRIGVVHGHLRKERRRILLLQPDYLLSGHTHNAGDTLDGAVRRINPGALHRARIYTVAVLDLDSDELKFLEIGA